MLGTARAYEGGNHFCAKAEARVTCRLSKAGQMSSSELRASRLRLVRDVISELAKSKRIHACFLTHAT